MSDRISIVLVVIMSAFTYASVAKADYDFATDGLVSYWTFDKANVDAETAKDVWGNSDGEIVGEPVLAEGRIGDALDFDGKDDYLDCGDDPSLAIITPMTIEAWVKYNTFATNYIVARRAGAIANTQYYLGSNIDSDIIMIRSGDQEITIGGAAATVGKDWHHLVGVIDGADSKLYLDAVEMASGALPDPPDKEGYVTIGSRGTEDGGGLWFFDGLIDEVRIYNRPLSEAEVQQNFEAIRGYAVAPNATMLSIAWGKIKAFQSSVAFTHE